MPCRGWQKFGKQRAERPSATGYFVQNASRADKAGLLLNLQDRSD